MNTSTADHEHTELNCETCIDRQIWSQLDA